MVTTEPHPLDADRPIDLAQEDRLDRGPFAVSLADAISSWNGVDSLVIGMYGPWGVGKTSIVNLVTERLRRDGHTDVLIFNPWEWSRYDDIAKAFFAEVSKILKQDADQEASDRWARYVSVLERADDVRSALLRLAPIVRNVLVVLGIVGVFAFDDNLLKLLSALGSVVGAFIQELAELVSKAQRPSPVPSLAEAKEAVRTALRHRRRTMLVIIDDVDRLAPEETTRVFQLVRANADFPRMVYLLPFSLRDVSQSIHRALGVDGVEYVDKMVHVALDVPKPNERQLNALFDSDMARALGVPIEAIDLDSERLRGLFHGGLNAYLATPRSIKRFWATMRLKLGVHRQAVGYDVDVIDFMGIEALGMFEPAIRDALYDKSEDFVGARADERQLEHDENARRSRIREMFELAKRRSAAEHIIRSLFPATAGIATGPPEYVSTEAAIRDLRICDEANFPRYFEGHVLDTDVHSDEISDLVSVASTPSEVAVRIASLAERRALSSMLRRLRANPSVLPSLDIHPFMAGLFDASESLSNQGEGTFWVSDSLSAAFLVYALLEQSPSEHRTAVLHNAIRLSRGVFLPVYVLAMDIHRREQEQAVIPQDGRDSLLALLEPRLRDFVVSDAMASSRHIAQLVYRTRDWSGASVARAAVDKLMSTGRGLAAFTRAFRTVRSSSTPTPLFDIIALEEWSPLERLQLDAQTVLDKESLGDEDREVLSALIAAIGAHREGHYAGSRDRDAASEFDDDNDPATSGPSFE